MEIVAIFLITKRGTYVRFWGEKLELMFFYDLK